MHGPGIVADKQFIYDELNLFDRGIEAKASMGGKVKLAVLDDEDVPYIYRAAALNMFRDVEEIAFI